MSKKKIVILIIMLTVLIGLIFAIGLRVYCGNKKFNECEQTFFCKEYVHSCIECPKGIDCFNDFCEYDCSPKWYIN
jgi:hypothetical protein